MRKDIYTADEVHQIIEKVLYEMELIAPPSEGQMHLENNITHTASSSDARPALSVSEAAALLGISKPKVYELVNIGAFHSINIGKKILISRKLLTDWIEKGDSYGKKAC